MTVLGKPTCLRENQLSRTGAYARKYAFEHVDANGNKEKEARFTRRQSVGLASNLDSRIFARH